MPIYEYACPDCNNQFDAFQKMSDPPVTVCPKCGGGSVRKLISATAFVLKGSGWYKDHYGLKSSSDSSSSGDSASASGASSSAATPAAPAPAPSAAPSSSGSGSSGSSTPAAST